MINFQERFKMSGSEFLIYSIIGIVVIVIVLSFVDNAKRISLLQTKVASKYHQKSTIGDFSPNELFHNTAFKKEETVDISKIEIIKISINVSFPKTETKADWEFLAGTLDEDLYEQALEVHELERQKWLVEEEEVQDILRRTGRKVANRYTNPRWTEPSKNSYVDYTPVNGSSEVTLTHDTIINVKKSIIQSKKFGNVEIDLSGSDFGTIFSVYGDIFKQIHSNTLNLNVTEETQKFQTFSAEELNSKVFRKINEEILKSVKTPTYSKSLKVLKTDINFIKNDFYFPLVIILKMNLNNKLEYVLCDADEPEVILFRHFINSPTPTLSA